MAFAVPDGMTRKRSSRDKRQRPDRSEMIEAGKDAAGPRWGPAARGSDAARRGDAGRGKSTPGVDLELAVLLEPAVDRPAGDTEGARRLFLVVAVDGQGAQNQLLLDLGQRGHGVA